MKYFFVSVDVDTLKQYYKIHGQNKFLKENDQAWDLAIPRFLKLFKKFKIKCNFFIIGEDLNKKKNSNLIKKMIVDGHSINSHSYFHNYDMVEKNFLDINHDIKSFQKILKRKYKVNNICFRAPGYKINKKIYKSLKQNNILISSSILPSFIYSCIKNFFIFKINFFGKKKSKSITDNLLKKIFEKKNYFINNNVLEVPISTIDPFSIPFIGTFLSLMGIPGYFFFKHFVSFKSIVNLEFHAIDLLDTSDLKNHTELKSRQIDLSISKNKKIKIFTKWLNFLSKNYKNILLEDFYHLVKRKKIL